MDKNVLWFGRVIIKWFSSYLIIMIFIGYYLFIMMVFDKEFDSWCMVIFY